MDVGEKHCLTSHLVDITRDLRVDDVIPHLIQDQFLTNSDVELIKSRVTSRDQCMEMIEILTRRGPGAFLSFKSALEETHYEHLCSLLDYKPAHISGCDQLMGELKDYYQTELSEITVFPGLEWFTVRLDKVYTSLRMIRQIKRKSFAKDLSKIGYDNIHGPADIFRPHADCPNPRRILIEGEPGIGKSTLCCKLALDWSQKTQPKSVEEPDPNHSIQAFKLVILLRARSFTESMTVYDAARDQLLPEDFPMDAAQLQKVVENNQEAALWIVDGYDELTCQNESLKKLLSRKILNKSTVLVTTRPSFALDLMKNIDTLFVNVGYSEKNREDFVRKYSAEVTDGKLDCDSLISAIERNSVARDLSRNPLNLTILCMLYADNNNDFPESKTDLYEEVTDFMLVRAAKKMDTDREIIDERMSALYKLCYQTLKNGQYNFTDDDLREVNCDPDILLQLGFFSREISISRGRKCTTYSFSHKSFLEFFSAKHISCLSGDDLKASIYALLGDFAFVNTSIFLFGLIWKSEEKLITFLAVLKDSSFNKTSYLAFHQQSVFDICNSHKGHVLPMCLCEIDIQLLSLKAKEAVLNCVEGNVCFAYPHCSFDCVKGILKICQMMEDFIEKVGLLKDTRYSCHGVAETSWHVKHHGYTSGGILPMNVVIPADFIINENDALTVTVGELFRYSCIKSIGLFGASSLSQIAGFLETFSKCSGNIRKGLHKVVLKIKCVGAIQWNPEQTSIPDLENKIGGIELYSCENAEVVRFVLQSIPNGENISHMCIANCSINEANLRALLSKVEGWKNLYRFVFTGHDLHMMAPTQMRDLLERLSHLSTVEIFHMSHLPINPGQAGRDGPDETKCLDLLEKFLRKNPLRSFTVYGGQLGRPALETIDNALQGKANFAKLQLEECQLLYPNGLNPILKKCCELNSLQSLVFRLTELGESNLVMIRRILESTSSLKSLTISPIVSNIVTHITPGLKKNQSIQCLMLKKVAFEGESMSTLAEAISDHPELRHIELSMHPGHYFIDDSFQKLLNALKSCTKLSNLALRHFGVEDKHISAVADLVLGNTALVHLDLHHNRLTELGIQELSKVLATRTTILKCLDISDCHLTEGSPVIRELNKQVLCVKVNWF